jgi:hypothetical protein
MNDIRNVLFLKQGEKYVCGEKRSKFVTENGLRLTCFLSTCSVGVKKLSLSFISIKF